METIVTVIYYTFWLLINEIRHLNSWSHHFEQIFMNNILIYSKYDVIKLYDVIDIKTCWCKQILTNYISNESTLQDELNGIYNFVFYATGEKITEDLQFSLWPVSKKGHAEVMWHNNRQWKVDNYVAY